MRKLMTVTSEWLVLEFWFIVSVVVLCKIQTVRRTRFAVPVLLVGCLLLFSWLLPATAFAERTLAQLDGSTYFCQLEYPLMRLENTLDIRGTTLVCRERYIWVAPDIADAVASGTRGFKKRTVGTWYDMDKMQIVGREAQHQIVLHNGQHVGCIIFTISEDGNSIIKEDNGRTFTFRRVPQLPPPASPVANTAVSGPPPQENSPLQRQKEASPVAQVEARGEFYFLTKDGKKLTGAEASKVPLEAGTKVVTGGGGHVRLKLPDDTAFTVGPNSDLVIDKFVYDTDNTPKTIMASLTKGMFRWVTGKTAQKDPAQMKVTLPVGTIGIRGTDFEAVVEPNGRGQVALFSGQLEITEKKTGFTFILNAGQMVTFKPDGSVSRPRKGKIIEDGEEE